MPKPKKIYVRPKAKAQVETLAGDKQLPLIGFKSSMAPDEVSLKFIYSDYRVITAAVNQADYIYRANSVFDPDVTGVGGQPDGFDQWKALYGIYRVVACKVEVQAMGNGANTNGLCVVAFSDSSGSFSSAEEVAGLRHSVAATYSQTTAAKVSILRHISSLQGCSDESILANPEQAALVTANPNSAQYVHVALETGNSATVPTMIWTKLTYYTRMERPTAVLDTAAIHSRDFALGRPVPTVMPSGPKRNQSLPTTTCSSTNTGSTETRDDVVSAAVSVATGAMVPTTAPRIRSQQLLRTLSQQLAAYAEDSGPSVLSNLGM
jgi:hypothetical protein